MTKVFNIFFNLETETKYYLSPTNCKEQIYVKQIRVFLKHPQNISAKLPNWRNQNESINNKNAQLSLFAQTNESTQNAYIGHMTHRAVAQ